LMFERALMGCFRRQNGTSSRAAGRRRLRSALSCAANLARRDGGVSRISCTASAVGIGPGPLKGVSQGHRFFGSCGTTDITAAVHWLTVVAPPVVGLYCTVFFPIPFEAK